jgi:hypothetical protein
MSALNNDYQQNLLNSKTGMLGSIQQLNNAVPNYDTIFPLPNPPTACTQQ